MIRHIAAVALDRTIGNAGAIPWHLPHDMKRFRTLTAGGVLIAGRLTAATMPAKLGLCRKLVVLQGGADILATLEQVQSEYAGRDIWIVGGARVYAATMHLADELFLTAVRGFYDGDTRYPLISPEFGLSRADHDLLILKRGAQRSGIIPNNWFEEPCANT